MAGREGVLRVAGSGRAGSLVSSTARIVLSGSEVFVSMASASGWAGEGFRPVGSGLFGAYEQ